MVNNTAPISPTWSVEDEKKAREIYAKAVTEMNSIYESYLDKLGQVVKEAKAREK